MSEVKVNKISPRTACGTTTLGDSGDTFNVPCGSKINLASGGNLTVASGATITNNGTQSGFGATGAVSWDTASIKATGFTAVSGNGYFCNTSGGAFTATLPASPTAGDIVAFSDYTRTFQTYSLTVGRNSKPIGGVAQDAGLSAEGQSATFVFVDDTEGWINTQETQTSQTGLPPYIVATGGTPCSGAIVCTNYKTHTFTGPGTFCVSVAGSPAGADTVDYMVVAGGGGAGLHGGGGGAGGFRESIGTASGCYTTSPLGTGPCTAALPVSIQGYPIVVGAGGAGAGCAGTMGTSGDNSSFSTKTSTGGGGGGGTQQSCNPGLDGGSGGASAPGAPSGGGTAGSGNTPSTTPPQGKDGGASYHNPGAYQQGGGGGGATTVGVSRDATPAPTAGAGGTGATTSISATPTAYAGGGGGASDHAPVPGGAGGTGGGGAGGNPSGASVAGTVNTGGGGGSSNSCGKGGGSGIVIIRYKFQ